MSVLSLLKAARMQPPVRRVLAVDAGSRNLKLLLAQSDFGRLRILKEDLVDLHAEGLVSADETKAHLQATLAQWGRPPLALVLPQHLSISQVIEVPLTPEDEVEKLIHAETLKLSGVSDSRIVYDFVASKTPAKNRREFWVTLAQEGEIRERILRLGIEGEDLCEVTTTANALMSAYRAAAPLSSRAILVHMGAQTTVVVVLLAGQGAFAASFQMGSDFFSRSLARLQGCPEEAADALKVEKDFFRGSHAIEGFLEVVDGWAAELKRQLNEWFDHNPSAAAEVASFELIASGGGFEQPGLLGYLRTEAGLDLHAWPKSVQLNAVSPSPRFEVAFGTALQALGYGEQRLSLLPETYQVNWQRRLSRQRFEFASSVLLVLCCLALLVGTWRQASLFLHKRALLAKVQAAQQTFQSNAVLTAQLAAQYENLRPLLAAEQSATDTLKTLALLRESRSNRSFWYVLLADQQSYFTLPAPTGTNRPARISPPVVPAPERPKPPPMDSFLGPALPTNPPPAKPGLIAELCVPEEPEAARRVLGRLVNDLKLHPFFSKVDLLSDDLHRSLAEPKVLIPDRHFVLALDFAATDFQQPLALKRAAPPGARSQAKHPARLPTSPAEREDRSGLMP